MPYMLNLQNLLRGWADALLAWLGVTPVHNDAWDRWVAFLLVVFVAVLFDFLCRWLLLRGVRHVVRRTAVTWDDELFSDAVLGRGCHVVSALLLLIVVLAVHSFTMPGAADGLAFFLLPDWSRAMEQGLGSVIVAAMNQSFFTLSLGIGAIEIFGSYMDRRFTLPGEAARICVLDTFVAVCAGLIIFPACFSFGISPDAGPSLIFITLPNVFTNMAGGRLWGALFFLFMTFASFSMVIAVFENIIACARENFGWDRRRACLVGAAALVVLGLPCALGYNVWSFIQPMGAGSTVLDFEDFLVSNLLLPGGSLVYLLFCVTKWGWGFDKYAAECNTGDGPKMPRWVKPYFKYVLPVLIAVILVQGLV